MNSYEIIRNCLTHENPGKLIKPEKIQNTKLILSF